MPGGAQTTEDFYAMKLTLTAALAIVAASTLPAISQAKFVEVEDAVMVQPFNQSADTVDDWDVFTADGIEVGEVEDVVGTDRNVATALAVDFDEKEGFADGDVIVPLDQFTYKDDRLILNATADAVSKMEKWND